ncbi:HPr family phosphocarrier protein [Ectobacillus panaciterrae]|uniref:HPr family phosphocarrier protein n=1 Tax=Ectobacillus panaciterrae TaxID=363872 RepID=UPI0003FA2A25|nr:HPr family phosphocarrier protein [Ectobacillus panaciterrae]
MKEKKLIVHLQHGLQARIATEFVQKASSFNSEITIIKNGRSVVAKSIMGVMAMAIRKGEEITLIANGIDEQGAIGALEGFLSNKR